MTGLELMAIFATTTATGLIIHAIAPPPQPLRRRIRPYLAPLTADLGRRANSDGVLVQVFGPLLKAMANRVSRSFEAHGSEVTVTKLRQAGWFPSVPDESVVAAYRMSQLRSLALGGAVGIAAGMSLGLPAASSAALGALGLVVGGTRQKGRLGRAIDDRRELMRIEIYTVNQLLAMRVRAGGGVIQAVASTVARGRGAVIDELEQALRLHRGGWRAAEAFRRIAETSPEPFCARTYRVLASAEERGSDLARSLLALSEDVREARRESIKRSATKRRAAMLIPTIAILAPILIVFVAAPLPYLITGWQ